MKITHYDLFAGIGGFSYALDNIFYEQKNEHIFCEWEAFPTTVLKKHWPDATYYGDIADLVTDTDRERRERVSREDAGRHGQLGGEISHQEQEMVILTGGFPCQPFSHAGRRNGTADDRYKWPEMFAVIRNVRPDWVIAENVRGLVTWNEGMVLETVCADLESEGYEVQPIIIPAVAVGAPHRRDRVWIVANRSSSTSGVEQPNASGQTRQHTEDSQREVVRPEIGETSAKGNKANSGTTPNPRHQRPEKSEQQSVGSEQLRGGYWHQDWREVAFATCYDGVDDGLPRRMDGATLRGKRTDTISASQHRKERLKACGNAIVPQVAMEIFKAIKETI